MRFFLALLSALAVQAGLAPAAQAEARTFTFRYEVVAGPFEAGAGPVHVWVPLARRADGQRVLAERIDASIPGEVGVESVYGNRYWQGTLAEPGADAVRVIVETTVEREVDRGREDETGSAAALAPYLGPNARVLVGDPILDPILAEIRPAVDSDDPADLSRGIYDWVVDNVEYKKVGTGWGNGDTFWACNERYGNCTDFHALITSLARTEGIPARFEMGFPVPLDRPSGEIGGYHCWLQLHLPGRGWLPIDASEAAKHPEKRELYYGTHPADRIHFSTGRDLRLGPDHRGDPLNYFVYPYVEAGGTAWEGPLEKRFAFREGAEAP